ncbi:hypothetical protein QTP88_027665 [Uroleucon formosanum]
MDNALNEPGPSRPKRICRNSNYQQQIEHILFNSDSDENNDLTDSGSEYECANIEDDLSDDFESEDEINTIQRDNSQSLTNINNGETGFHWQEEEIEMSNFPFTKQNELLVSMEDKQNPIDYIFLLFDDNFINLLVHETNNYAETEFLRVGGAPRSRISTWKPTDNEEMLTFIALIIHTGIFDDLGGKGHAANVVLHLMSEKLNNGHALYMDNFYNSFDLASKLIEKNTFCTGTLRLNRKNTPKDVVMSKLKKGETVARYSQGVMIGKWKDKRDVAYISTEFKNNMILSKNRNGKEQLKPEPISNYNRFMSGIDRQDQMNSYYPFTRKTVRWYKKIGIHIIQMLLMNSFYLYNQYHVGPKLSLYDYRLSVLGELLPKHPKPRNVSSNAFHIPKTLGDGKNGRTIRKRCQLCYSKKLRKDTSYFCPECPNQPSLCLEPCFKNFHQKKP